MRDFHGFTVGHYLILQLNTAAYVAFDSNMNIMVNVTYPDQFKTILGSCTVVLTQSGGKPVNEILSKKDKKGINSLAVYFLNLNINIVLLL
jgi:hypothetical protein